MNQANTGIAAEAAEDAASELDRLTTADNFEDPLAGQDLGAVVSPPEQQSVDLRGSFGVPRVLEDLYAEHPDIGAGTKFIRVIRRQPVTYRGMRIVGVLEDVHEQLSLADFADRFGGGTYDVTVMGHTGGVLAGDTAPVRSLRTLRLEVGGPPRVTTYGSHNAEVSVNTRQQTIGSDAVEVERIRADQKRFEYSERERQRLTEAISKASSMSPDMLSRIDSAAERRAQEVRASLTETLTIERELRKRQIAELESKDATINKLNQELLDERSRATMRMREVDTDKERELRKTYDTQFSAMKASYDAQITELKRSHDEEMKRLAAASTETLQRITEKATSEVAELGKRRDEERKAYIEAAERERERIRDDANQRHQQLVQDFTLRSGESHRQEELRLKEQEKSYQREIDALKSAHAREMDSVKMMTQNTLLTSEATSKVQIQSLQSELARMEARCKSVERENDELRAKSNKSVREVIAESHEVAGMTGWVPGGGEAPEAPKAFSWQESVTNILMGAIQKVPDVLRSIEEARTVNQAARQGMPPQAMVPAGYQRQLPGPQPMMPPQQQQQQQQAQHAARRAYRPAMAPQVPPAWGQQIDPITNPVLPQPGPPSMEAVASVPRKFVNPVGSAGKPPEPKNVPVAGQEVGRPAGGFTPFEDAKPEPQQVEAAPPPAPEQPQQAAQPNAVQVPFTNEQIDTAIKQLEVAVSTDMVKPDQAAAEFVKVLGPEATRAVVASVHPDQLVDQVVSGRPQTPLATYEGREYVRTMWEEMAKLAG